MMSTGEGGLRRSQVEQAQWIRVIPVDSTQIPPQLLHSRGDQASQGEERSYLSGFKAVWSYG
eukprot:6467786-Amphidinium_carterae.1